eukprot:scaffold1847_cov59-Phaeocystis_antarctica.AAC.3
MRGKLIPHRTGKLLCPALQVDAVGRQNWIATFPPAQEEPGHALAWLQAGRPHHGWEIGSLQLRPTENGSLQLRLMEVGSLQLRGTEVGLLQLCPAETLDPLLPETRGKLISHRIGKLLCPALQLEAVGRHNRNAFLPSQKEPGHALTWLQAGRTQREQLIGRRADTPLQQQLHPTEVGLVPLRLTEVEPLQVHSTEVGILQLRSKEDGLLQLCAAEVGPLQPSTPQIGILYSTLDQTNRWQTLDPLLPEMRGKLIPHRTGKLLCPALQLEAIRRHN